VSAGEAEVVEVYSAIHVHDSGLLWLVNQDNPLPSEYTPSNLVSHNGIFLQAPAHTAYNQMLAGMKADGIMGLQLASAYRPYEYQRNLFTVRVSELVAEGHSPDPAAILAAETLQPPGASEHQTGLALDVTVTGDLTLSFGETLAGIWLAENAHRFGFIIRYPYAKTEITQITYEPWHLRYVGLPHAVIIRDNNLTLEEYAGFISKAGAYIVWAEPHASRAYYLVIHSNTRPESLPNEVIAISSDRAGEGAGYIITLRGVYTTY